MNRGNSGSGTLSAMLGLHTSTLLPAIAAAMLSAGCGGTEAERVLGKYHLVDLGEGRATGVDGAAHVVGNPPFLWESGKRMDLDCNGSDSVSVTAISDSGYIVGYRSGSNPLFRTALVWRGTELVDEVEWESLPAGIDRMFGRSRARRIGCEFQDVSPDGIAVGATGFDVQGKPVASGGHMPMRTDLRTSQGKLLGEKFLDLGAALAISSAGDIVGYTIRGGALWTHDGKRHRIVPPKDAGRRESTYPEGVNAKLTVVGWFRNATDTIRPFIWTAESGFNELQAPHGDAEASAINDDGIIVGTATIDEENRAVAWVNGKLYDLNDLVDRGPTLRSAADVNSRGDIVGNARSSGSDKTRAFLLHHVRGS